MIAVSDIVSWLLLHRYFEVLEVGDRMRVSVVVPVLYAGHDAMFTVQRAVASLHDTIPVSGDSSS
jgi:hypothetical protein